MENTKLQAILDKKMEEDKQKELKQQKKDAKRLASLKKKADAYLPKIKEWIDNANQLLDADISVRPMECKKGANFCTDGISHCFGFWGFQKFFAGKFTQMGIAQGGWFGSRDVHTDGVDWWIIDHSTNEQLPMELNDYERLLDGEINRIDKFAVQFERFLENL